MKKIIENSECFTTVKSVISSVKPNYLPRDGCRFLRYDQRFKVHLKILLDLKSFNQLKNFDPDIRTSTKTEKETENLISIRSV